MYCNKCNALVFEGEVFCGSCGEKQLTKVLSPEIETTSDQSSSQTKAQPDNVKLFFKNSFMRTIKSIFSEPTKNTFDIFKNASDESYNHGIILILTTGIFYTILPYIFIGEARKYISFDTFFKLGVVVVITLLLISTFTFIVKTLSGKPDFKKELLTGGICGIPLLIYLSIISLLGLFGSDEFSIINLINGSFINGSVFLIILCVYLILMLFNVVQQSLKSFGTSDSLSWYISPLVICLAIYLGTKLSISILT
jgi:hypothetical protein